MNDQKINKIAIFLAGAMAGISFYKISIGNSEAMTYFTFLAFTFVGLVSLIKKPEKGK